jgi:hypothetical protein
VTLIETQADGVSRVVERSPHDGRMRALPSQLEYESADCTGATWVRGRISPSFALFLRGDGQIVAAPRDAGFGFSPGVTFASFSVDDPSFDGGVGGPARLCTAYQSCGVLDDGGFGCDAGTATADATRLEMVGFDTTPPPPPLLIVP